MARSPIPFRTAFEDFAGACGYTLAFLDTQTTLKARVLREFISSYKIGYDLPANGWEDARTGSTTEPVDRLIEWDVIGDAREFSIWDEDPRGTSDAARLSFTTSADGILLREDATEVWVEWIPLTVKFTTTAWVTSTLYRVGNLVLDDDSGSTTYGNCYRCLVQHTSGTFAADLASADWVLVPVLEVLAEFTIDYGQGTHLLRTDAQHADGLTLRANALDALEKIARQEIQRNARGGVWQSFISSAVAAVSATLRYLRFDAVQTLTDAQRIQALSNLGITFTSGGYLRLENGDGDVLHIGLNTGEPPG